jgi:hypothetical protein
VLTVTPLYRNNLAALAAFQPKVGEIIDTADIPVGVTPATGRDGSNTLRIPAEDGRLAWFGGSSMPSVSAPEMFAGFVNDGRNVSLPGVLTGAEPLVVINKMPPHTAVFVLEEHAWHVKLALHLYDYVEPIAAGRLIFVVGDDVEESMCGFFEANPGYDPPARLLTPPQRFAAEIAELQRRLENAGASVSRVCQQAVDACALRIGARSFDSFPKVPRVAVLSLDVRPSSIEQAKRVQRALAKLQWPHEVCVPDAPGRCHPASRLLALDRVSADLVLLINSPGGQMAPLLPSELPIVSWYLPGSDPRPAVGASLSANQMIFTCSRALAEHSGKKGAASQAIYYCEVAADDAGKRGHSTFLASTPGAIQAEGSRALLGLDVAILMDLPDDRAEACDVTLASHLVFWKALRDIVAKNVDSYEGSRAGELVDQAQRVSGVMLEDPAIREHFIGLVRARIAPACMGRAAAQVVRATRCRFAVWGLNWPSTLDGQKSRGGGIPVGKELNELFNATSIVVLPDSSATAMQMALDALAAGIRVVCRAPDQPFEQVHPGLRTLAPYLHLYRTTGELNDILNRLRVQPDGGDDETSAARAIVLADHCVSHRLEAILDQVRVCQPASTPTLNV